MQPVLRTSELLIPIKALILADSIFRNSTLVRNYMKGVFDKLGWHTEEVRLHLIRWSSLPRLDLANLSTPIQPEYDDRIPLPGPHQ